MTPIISRLQHRPQFLKVAGARQKWVTPGLILQARCRLDDESDDVPSDAIRIGFTVSKKVGNAVMRNRARRRLRAVAEEVLARHARAGYDYVVIGRAVTVRRPYTELVNDLQSALKRIKA